MRIRKRQHPIAHGIAFLLIGGASAPVSAGMMGAKAHRNKLADEEAERLAGWLAGWLAGGSPLVRAQNDAAQQIIDHERAVQAARELLAAEEASLAAEEASWSTVTGTLVSWGKKGRTVYPKLRLEGGEVVEFAWPLPPPGTAAHALRWAGKPVRLSLVTTAAGSQVTAMEAG